MRFLQNPTYRSTEAAQAAQVIPLTLKERVSSVISIISICTTIHQLPVTLIESYTSTSTSAYPADWIPALTSF
ncbi:MAG: hypothetical protein EB157_01505 [Euryarchaeota archaeon]|nr:hypothetical protein [Euryarchaeota archaeon]